MEKGTLIAENWGTTPDGTVIVDDFNMINLFKVGFEGFEGLKTILTKYSKTTYLIKEDEDSETISLVVSDKDLFSEIKTLFNIIYLT